MTQAEKLALEEIVKRKASEIMEHADSVQIFITKHSGGDCGTVAYAHGQGNWYSRYGQIQEWMMQQDNTGPSELEEFT